MKRPKQVNFHLHRYCKLDHAQIDEGYALLPRSPRARPLERLAVTQVNGRSGTRLGRAKSKQAPSIETALLDLAATAKRRRQRGYELTN
jgi:hypothetical protein